MIGFDHLIIHALSCTLESENESVMGYGHICFGSLDQVINDNELVSLNEGKARNLGALEEWSSLMGLVEPSRGSKTEAIGLLLGWLSSCCSGRATTSSSQLAFLFYVQFFVGFKPFCPILF